MNMNAAARYLFAALEHARNASARVQQMVKVAISRFLDLCRAQAAAASVLAKAAA